MRDQFLTFGVPRIEEAEIREVMDTLRSGWLGTGPKVAKFEEMFRNYKDTKHALALNSCTSALHLSLLAVGITPGDEVIVPVMTFAATANAVIHAGARPVFADCEKFSMNISPEDIERKITPRTKAIIPVHFAGRPCDMDAILFIAKKHNLKIIEDCAHAIETEYYGEKAGTMGDLGCFSFYVTKNIVTGEGGMAITLNDEYANFIKILSLHGMSKDAWKRFGNEGYVHYAIQHAGFKYNMTDINASLGIHQLGRINEYWRHREAIWNQYNSEFADLPVYIPAPIGRQIKHAYHLYTLLLDIERTKLNRDQFLQQMTMRKLGVGVHYLALHLHPYYQQAFGYRPGDFPNAEWVSERTVSMPLSAKMTREDTQDVIGAVKNILNPSHRSFQIIISINTPERIRGSFDLASSV